MRKEIFVEDGFYHVYNRGVEKRQIFLDDADRYRFIYSLYEFNDSNPTENLITRVNYRGRTSIKEKREILIQIACFCLMPTHFHLILRQIAKNGIPKFMQKIGTGYTMYFNKKYERSGVLFQGRFKSKFIDKEEYFMHLSRYIHLNPIELIEPKWKEKGIKDEDQLKNFLKTYRWSSCQDYIGKRNFPFVIEKDTLTAYFQDPESYLRFLYEYSFASLSRFDLDRELIS